MRTDRAKYLQTLSMLRALKHYNGKIKLAFSGGKDSVVIYDLAKKSGVNFVAIYNNTTIDPPGTLNFIRKNFPDVKIQQPAKSFYKLVETRGLPNRFQRWCCRELKENQNAGFDLLITGVRRAESTKRAKYEFFGERKDITEFRPILFWTNTQVWDYIEANNLPIMKYYKPPYNYTRHGCVMCPLATSKNMIQDAKNFPRHAKALIKAIRKFRENKQHLPFVQSFKNEYDMMYLYLLQKLNKEGQRLLYGALWEVDTKKRLEEILKIKL